MRAFEFLTEAGLSASGLRQTYLDNLIQSIRQEKPIALIPTAQTDDRKSVIIDPAEADRLQAISDETDGALNYKNYLDLASPIGKIKLKDSNDTIALSSIEKSIEIKGIEDDFNIGDIGEISLGVATAAKFVHGGNKVGAKEFIEISNQLTSSTVTNSKGKILQSLRLTFSGKVNHPNGKRDNITVTILGPGRSIVAFQKFMENPGTIPKKVTGTMLSAIEYANNEEKIQAGLEQTAKDPNVNTIEVLCDGVSDQKGTKADLVMTIDGNRINLLSAKTGASQLGQASGHDWKKQASFFATVFQVKVDAYEKQWGTTNDEHIATLQSIYNDLVIPKILTLTGGDSVQKEIELVRSISNGLIRYSNNVNVETGEIETVDIVKLVVDPSSPGYGMLRIDSRLTDALEKTDLYGQATPNRQGVQVMGKVEGRNLLLFKARSYHSVAGNVIRTIVEGGPLLDKLAAITPKSTQVQPVAPKPDELAAVKKNAGIKPPSEVPNNANPQ
jgi:hypothetical protein